MGTQTTPTVPTQRKKLKLGWKDYGVILMWISMGLLVVYRIVNPAPSKSAPRRPAVAVVATQTPGMTETPVVTPLPVLSMRQPVFMLSVRLPWMKRGQWTPFKLADWDSPHGAKVNAGFLTMFFNQSECQVLRARMAHYLYTEIRSPEGRWVLKYDLLTHVSYNETTASVRRLLDLKEISGEDWEDYVPSGVQQEVIGSIVMHRDPQSGTLVAGVLPCNDFMIVRSQLFWAAEQLWQTPVVSFLNRLIEAEDPKELIPAWIAEATAEPTAEATMEAQPASPWSPTSIDLGWPVGEIRLPYWLQQMMLCPICNG